VILVKNCEFSWTLGHEPSVCRLWRCTLPRELNFSAIFLHPLIAQGIGHFVLKFWEKLEGFIGHVPVKYKGYENWRFSRNISLYFENGSRYDHSYNGRRIGTRIRPIEWCHFLLPRVTPNLNFKVTVSWTISNSKTVHVTMAKTGYVLLNGVILNDLGWPLTQLSSL